MKDFWVLWTYIANFSRLMHVQAKDDKEAVERTVGYFSEDFRKKATIYVFDHKPVMVLNGGISEDLSGLGPFGNGG